MSKLSEDRKNELIELGCDIASDVESDVMDIIFSRLNEVADENDIDQNSDEYAVMQEYAFKTVCETI
jgi:hypothetical protein